MKATGASRQTQRERREALNSLPEPGEDEQVMQVRSSRGGNLYELIDGDGNAGAYTLPKSQRHVVLIRPGIYVIAHPYEPSNGRVAGEIVRVLLKHHVDHLATTKFWPASFRESSGASAASEALVDEANTMSRQRPTPQDEDHRGDDEESDEEEDIPRNENRRAGWTDIAETPPSTSDDEMPE